MTTFTCETFTDLDQDILTDFYTCFQEAQEEIELCCHRLEKSPSPEDVHDLFRSMHSLKGNCRMVFLDPLVDVSHKLEEIVSDIRDDKYSYEPVYGEFMLAVISRIDELISQLLHTGEADQDLLDILENYILQVREADDSGRVDIVNRLLDQLVGGEESELAPKKPRVVEQPEEVEDAKTSDLDFFHTLAVKLDRLFLFKQGTAFNEQLKMAAEINKELGDVVSHEELSAAVYLHDIGMAFVPWQVLNKHTTLTPEEQLLYQDHVRIGAGLVRRMTGWQGAADMIEHHHEHFDGTGFPGGLKADQINIGGMILAVIDTYQKVLHQHSDVSFRKTLLRAVTEINSNSNSKFDPTVVDAFNLVVRRHYVAQR
ncbi:HD domain-containing phosphohydrolase [Zooshikella harenae]|uniref:HD domain-containing protein n=1 Tax=Zooshikella harenae TaxID=2827238 RepID=A0ABS5Z6N5_9GAMM|nr:HD domain-containing phosphohydrolase [Zooshikella harenae]MBU2709660.1 HD domain-containing protein [Zooshikella harenae]